VFNWRDPSTILKSEREIRADLERIHRPEQLCCFARPHLMSSGMIAPEMDHAA